MSHVTYECRVLLSQEFSLLQDVEKNKGQKEEHHVCVREGPNDQACVYVCA